MNKSKSNKIQKKSKNKKANKDSGQTVYPDGYVRPKVTASEMLSSSDIKKRMKNFTKVNDSDLDELVDGDKVRYFENMGDGKFKYKPGGFVLKNKAPTYLVLTNNGMNWSVQLNNHIIFKSKDIDQIEEEHKQEIDKLKQTISHLHGLLVKQKRVISKLTKN
jgi:hypothetical protein